MKYLKITSKGTERTVAFNDDKRGEELRQYVVAAGKRGDYDEVVEVKPAATKSATKA